MAPRGRRRAQPSDANNDDDLIPTQRARLEDSVPESSNNPAPDFLSNEDIQAAIEAEEQINQRRRQIQEDQAMARLLQNNSPPTVQPTQNAIIRAPVVALPSLGDREETAATNTTPQSQTPPVIRPIVQPISSTSNPIVSTSSSQPSSVIPSTNVSTTPSFVSASSILQFMDGPSLAANPVENPEIEMNALLSHSLSNLINIFASRPEPPSTSVHPLPQPNQIIQSAQVQSAQVQSAQVQSAQIQSSSKVRLATKPIPYDGSACAICFEDVPDDPVACQFCKKCIGCRSCLVNWSKAANLPNHRQCPLCRFDWKNPKPKIVAMFISQAINDASNPSNSPAVTKSKAAKKTPTRPKAKSRARKAPIISEIPLVEASSSLIQFLEASPAAIDEPMPMDPPESSQSTSSSEVSTSSRYNTRSSTRRQAVE